MNQPPYPTPVNITLDTTTRCEELPGFFLIRSESLTNGEVTYTLRWPAVLKHPGENREAEVSAMTKITPQNDIEKRSPVEVWKRIPGICEQERKHLQQQLLRQTLEGKA